MAGQKISFYSRWSATFSGKAAHGEIIGGVFASQDELKYSFLLDSLSVDFFSSQDSGSLQHWDQKSYVISVGIGVVNTGTIDYSASISNLTQMHDADEAINYVKLYRSIAVGENIEDCAGFERTLFSSTISFSKGYAKKNIRPNRRTVIRSSSTSEGLGLIIHLGGMDSSIAELAIVPHININGVIEL